MLKHTIACVLVLGLSAIVPEAAHARKPLRVLGCSSTDLNTFGASICLKKGERDILSGSSSVHVAVCSGGQIYCCITKDGSTSGGRCANVTSKQSSGNGGLSGRDNGNIGLGGSGISGPAPSGDTKGGGSGCSGGVC